MPHPSPLPPPGTEIPGLVRHFDAGGDLDHNSYFPHGGDYKPPLPPPSLDPSPRHRGTNLGVNL